MTSDDYWLDVPSVDADAPIEPVKLGAASGPAAAAGAREFTGTLHQLAAATYATRRTLVEGQTPREQFASERLWKKHLKRRAYLEHLGLQVDDADYLALRDALMSRVESSRDAAYNNFMQTLRFGRVAPDHAYSPYEIEHRLDQLGRTLKRGGKVDWDGNLPKPTAEQMFASADVFGRFRNASFLKGQRIEYDIPASTGEGKIDENGELKKGEIDPVKYVVDTLLSAWRMKSLSTASDGRFSSFRSTFGLPRVSELEKDYYNVSVGNRFRGRIAEVFIPMAQSLRSRLHKPVEIPYSPNFVPKTMVGRLIRWLNVPAIAAVEPIVDVEPPTIAPDTSTNEPETPANSTEQQTPAKDTQAKDTRAQDTTAEPQRAPRAADKLAENKPAENKPADNKPADKPADKAAPKAKPADKPAEAKAAENKPAPKPKAADKAAPKPKSSDKAAPTAKPTGAKPSFAKATRASAPLPRALNTNSWRPPLNNKDYYERVAMLKANAAKKTGLEGEDLERAITKAAFHIRNTEADAPVRNVEYVLNHDTFASVANYVAQKVEARENARNATVGRNLTD